ncbi:MAG: hypothetical protein KME26_20955 [Oscillatoria princeps RMCB-10]|jgi:hypothetical protein|nr:hypothetical protein [Oscillatoria princeps RMCB-10]
MASVRILINKTLRLHLSVGVKNYLFEGDGRTVARQSRYSPALVSRQRGVWEHSPPQRASAGGAKTDPVAPVLKSLLPSFF